MKAGKILSYVLPVSVEEGTTSIGQHYEVNFENGVKVLNSKNTNYSFGSLHQIMLKGITEVLRTNRPEKVLMLGLGAGSAIQILQNKCRQPLEITVVEIDPDLINIANRHFGLSNYERVRVVQGDASVVIHELGFDQFDLIIDDVFWDNSIPDFCRKSDYMKACHHLLSHDGVYMRNTMALDGFPFDDYERELKNIFGSLRSVVHPVYKNKIYFCRRRAAK